MSVEIEVNEVQEQVDYPTDFKDEKGREWNVKISVPVLHGFCKEHNLSLADIFNIGQLSADVLMDLAYSGTRYQSRAKATRQTKEEFLNDIDGASFLHATGAAANAVLNFCLKMTPPSERAKEKAKIDEVMRIAEENGNGETSTD